MSSNEELFVPKSDRDVAYSNLDADKEDKAAADSEATGTISKGMWISRHLPSLLTSQTRSTDSRTPSAAEKFWTTRRATRDHPTRMSTL